jgi:DNA-binding NarL/FixJ family response regulator
MSISVLIVDDHAIVRSGLRCMLEDSEVQIAGEAVDGKEALDQTLKLNPDVVLLDIRMQKSDGLEALRLIREQSPATRVMILSTYDNPTYVARSVALGAKDYVLKGCSREVLLERIRGVAADQPPSADSILHRVKVTMDQRKNVQSDFPLTNRELQVLRHIALGLSNREIGTSLQISVETVKEHVQNILRKINAVDRTQAAVWAVKRGLIP